VSTQSFVIVGGGQAGAWACKTLRDEGFDGRLVIVGAETHLPYERPPLSKGVLAGESEPESTRVFPVKWYDDWAVELRLGNAASRLEAQDSTLWIDDGTKLKYDRLLLATGGTPRKLALCDESFDNVFYLRSIEDSLAIRHALGTRGHILIVGGGWIGLEVAATARKLGSSVTVAESAPVLCGRAASPQLSDFLYRLHRDHGVEIILNARITALDGTGRVERARFHDGSSLDVSAIIVGVGLCPSTGLAEQGGITVANGIVVDDAWQTSQPNVFAAGDVANFRTAGGQFTRLESWDNAQKQGISAGKAMLGKTTGPDAFPWFWSDQYGRNIQLIGELDNCDEVVNLGEAASGPAISLFLRGGRVAGALAIDAGRGMRVVKRALQNGGSIDIDTLAAQSNLHQWVKKHDAQR
jgi:3-phenylpropionate/trans-cinnamate dioxygenase ferredoxin reductase component